MVWAIRFGGDSVEGGVREQKQAVKVSSAYIEAGCVREIGE